MDPVNKWLSVIILFMVALLIVIWHSSGAGRYEMTVMPSSTYAKHYVIFVLDTKDGNVNGKLVVEDEMLNGADKVRRNPIQVFEQPSKYRYRQY